MDARDQALPARIGRYRIERLLGRGAMGRVLLGRDDVLDREVAVKLLRDDLTLAPEQRAALLARMQHEAKACARVTHPNIVALFDMGDDPAFGLYLVFEYAEGTTLKERLVQSPLPVALAARLLCSRFPYTARALERRVQEAALGFVQDCVEVAAFGAERQ
jgi:serine/threonine protein kinase